MAIQLGSKPPAWRETVEEIMGIYRSLPRRPTIDEVQAAMVVIETVEDEERQRMEEISRMEEPEGVPKELFRVLQKMRRHLIMLRSHEQRKEALFLLKRDKIFEGFDQLIQKASDMLVSSEGHGIQVGGFAHEIPVIKDERKKETGHEKAMSGVPTKEISDDNQKSVVSVDSVKPALVKDGDSFGTPSSACPYIVYHKYNPSQLISVACVNLIGEKAEKLCLINVASLIEASQRSGITELDLHGKLVDQMERLPNVIRIVGPTDTRYDTAVITLRLPVSLGELSNLVTLNLAENRIMVLPSTVGELKSLVKLYLHSNQLMNLPDSFGDLSSLVDLDLHGNFLKSLPNAFGNLSSLTNLDLSTNQLSTLPETFGNLTRLRRLNIETNELEELPHWIGLCSSLTELRADFNQLKALPEAIGKLEMLEILTLHYNRTKGLPTTMASLVNLKELDVSFNELESVPESLCLVTSLVKLNIGKNFADLRSLPSSIGNLELLEELDISDNQIRVLPDSFGLLTKLRVLRADETPLELPPREIATLGAQEVVQYMAKHVRQKDRKVEPAKINWFWHWLLCLFSSGKVKHDNVGASV
ncbi:Plant intracellular Ras-group-related LRR protein 5 [Nymphaea thermarum]|nr:Plant intracellular Ras-group-related LRR protein 5 [Nymphaea thermarum]